VDVENATRPTASITRDPPAVRSAPDQKRRKIHDRQARYHRQAGASSGIPAMNEPFVGDIWLER